MKDKVNIVVVVDVIGALSDDTLLNGNLCLIDDGSDQSTGQGTPELCTAVEPGQTVQWSALAVDLQTPVEIKSITFLGDETNKPAGRESGDTNGGRPQRGGHPRSHDRQAGEQRENGHARSGQHERSHESESLELDVWAGVVPPVMRPGVPYRYRLEVQMYEGSHSTLHIDSPALIRQ
ncbi:hypothetical protein [Streptomyces tsukubensis]|uniref:Inclusion body protein n=1 Tax=Streptomyces tsukubensis TaxID=83656 RepID=A0A1V4A9C1_9ACTN|nr:hypothetical protein [Streptomyces tsukubensis]OON80071.1 hypothetical protein B1H18_12910 [Streptomyces tsukubensis]QFR97303.1 hypothetical protein GBW32_34875 [Streptomyces tsukubensis]